MAATILRYDSLIDNATLIRKLKQDFPSRRIQKILFEQGFQVRKNSFTTHNVAIKTSAKKGTLTVTSTYDMVWMYLFICFPMFFYIIMKRKSQEDFKASVTDRLDAYHNNPAGIF